MQRRLLVAVIAISISGLVAIAQVEQPEPMAGTYVHDFAGVIAGDKKAEIQAKAQRLKDEYKTEIALVTIDSLQGEDSFDYSMRMARSWGIGSPDNDIRGLLILVAVKDRKTSFRTSRHVEGEIPDSVTYDVSQIMNAHFKRGDFGGGLSAGMDKILFHLQSVYEPSATSPQKQSSGWVWLLLILSTLGAGVVVSIVVAVRKRRRERERREAEARQRKAKPARRPAQRSKSVKSKKAKSSSRPFKPSSPSSSYDSGYSSNLGSSSSYDSGSSSSYDSGSSYSGGSDFGGGGSDSSW